VCRADGRSEARFLSMPSKGPIPIARGAGQYVPWLPSDRNGSRLRGLLDTPNRDNSETAEASNGPQAGEGRPPRSADAWMERDSPRMICRLRLAPDSGTAPDDIESAGAGVPGNQAPHLSRHCSQRNDATSSVRAILVRDRRKVENREGLCASVESSHSPGEEGIYRRNIALSAPTCMSLSCAGFAIK
jgi:hypothetical protein